MYVIFCTVFYCQINKSKTKKDYYCFHLSRTWMSRLILTQTETKRGTGRMTACHITLWNVLSLNGTTLHIGPVSIHIYIIRPLKSSLSVTCCCRLSCRSHSIYIHVCICIYKIFIISPVWLYIKSYVMVDLISRYYSIQFSYWLNNVVSYCLLHYIFLKMWAPLWQINILWLWVYTEAVYMYDDAVNNYTERLSYKTICMQSVHGADMEYRHYDVHSLNGHQQLVTTYKWANTKIRNMGV